MATLSAIRDAIKTTLEANISGLMVYDTVPDVTQVPSVVVLPRKVDFNVSMARGTDTWTFDLFVLAPRTETRLAQDSLDAYITGSGSSSIRQVIYNNDTLGLANTQAHVESVSDYGGQYRAASVPHVGAQVTLTVHTSGTS